MIPIKTSIIAHRGASAYAPENTISAFQKAVDSKANGIELDIKFSFDRKIIIIHDQTVDRTTNGKGKVKDLSSMELRSLDAGSYFSIDFQKEKIPFLHEVLEKFSDKLLINIEITNYASIMDGLAKATAMMVKEFSVQKSILFSSFHPMNLLITKRILPEVPVALLALPGKSGWLARSNLLRWVSPQIIHPYFKDVDYAYIQKQHQRKRKVNIWTINLEDDMKKFVNASVDGLITDDPILGRKIIESA